MKIETPPTVEGEALPSQEHFKTDHLLANLKGHTISSGVVTVSAQGAKFFLSLASTMILARLLLPWDFGLVAMVTTVTGFLRVFKDAGLSTATVQREKITHAQVSNLFWINVAVSAVCTVILAAAAPLVARFYHDERLIRITLFLSATFLLSGSTAQHQALLRRQMRFKALAGIEVGSMAVAVVVGLSMALLGYGYWSLVGSALALEISSLVLTWSISRWRPQLPVSHSGTGPLLHFGIHRTAADFISSLSRGPDTLLLGRFYGAVSVGLYSRANALLIRPLELFLGPISAVFIPALSRLQSQPERYRVAFLRVYEAILLIAFVFAGLLLPAARPITLVLLGPKWEQAGLIFEGFTIAALCLPLANAAWWLLISQGRGRDMLLAQSINSCTKVLSFIAGLPYGAVGVAVAYSAYSLLIRVPVWYFMVGNVGPVRATDLWQLFFRHLPVWIVVSAATWLTLRLVGDFGPLGQVVLCMVGGGAAGALFISIFKPQRHIALELLGTFQELMNNRRPNNRNDVQPQ